MEERKLRNKIGERLSTIKAPNSFVIIFAFILMAAVLTFVVPAGEYDRVCNDTGAEVVLADSFHYVESAPIGPMALFVTIAEAFAGNADIIFCILFAYCFVGALVESGAFHAVIQKVMNALKNRTALLLPLVMLLFGVMGSVAGIAEETFGMFPICITLAFALGYDRIVGGSIVYLAVFTGFAAATFNPYTVGVAQTIAGVPLYSGILYRMICFFVFMSILILYVMRYAAKIKADPSKSILFGYEEVPPQTKLDGGSGITGRQLCALLLFALIFFFIVFGAIQWGWYINEILALFVIGFILMGIINRWSPNTMGDKMVTIGSGTLFSMLIIGFSNTVSLVLEKGRIIDTIVHYMASWMNGSSGYFSAFLMLIIQNLLNFFIPSGPGQAGVSMPIMAAFADVTGNTRQLAVLAFQFGDGFSNIFWPTMVCMMCGILKVPIGKWYRFVAPLFGIMFLAQVVLLMVAVAIGY